MHPPEEAARRRHSLLWSPRPQGPLRHRLPGPRMWKAASPNGSTRASPRRGPTRPERTNEMEVWAFVQYRPFALESAANATSARTKTAPSCTAPMPLSWHPCGGISTRLYSLPTSSTSIPNEEDTGSCRRKCARISSSVNILSPGNTNHSARQPSDGGTHQTTDFPCSRHSCQQPVPAFFAESGPYSPPYMTKRSRPPCFAWYKATSALAYSSSNESPCSGAMATPMLTETPL